MQHIFQRESLLGGVSFQERGLLIAIGIGNLNIRSAEKRFFNESNLSD